MPRVSCKDDGRAGGGWEMAMEGCYFGVFSVRFFGAVAKGLCQISLLGFSTLGHIWGVKSWTFVERGIVENQGEWRRIEENRGESWRIKGNRGESRRIEENRGESRRVEENRRIVEWARGFVENRGENLRGNLRGNHEKQFKYDREWISRFGGI